MAQAETKDAGADNGYEDITPTEAIKKLEHAELLLTVTEKLAATQSLDEVLETLIGITTKATNAERGSPTATPRCRMSLRPSVGARPSIGVSQGATS